MTFPSARLEQTRARRIRAADGNLARTRCPAQTLPGSREKLAGGEVRDINDLITFNLDIRQFAQDVIENCEGPELLRAFWDAIDSVTILDPTCGSGAFLFAALNILEPLYEACLDRMEGFVEDHDRSANPIAQKNSPTSARCWTTSAAHPNRRYFIFKTIILNNLFGVDIMEEAVEICKLRLFLKLAAQVEPDATKDNFGSSRCRTSISTSARATPWSATRRRTKCAGRSKKARADRRSCF